MNSPNKSATVSVADFLFLPFFQTPLIPNSRIQRIVHSLFSIWKGLRKKRDDKRKGMAELMREVSMGFTRLLRFLRQK